MPELSKEVVFVDPMLAGVAADLGLRFPQNSRVWQHWLRTEVPAALAKQVRRFRKLRDAGRITDGTFYRLIADSALANVMLEGRLGYYNSVLPGVIEAIAQVPHRRILDVGSFGGIVCFCLGRRFPESQIVGVERLGAWVKRAREFQTKLALGNVQFVHNDFRSFVPRDQFDVVVSVNALPITALPPVPAESARSHHRGRLVPDMAATASHGIRQMASCFAAFSWLATSGATVIVHERAGGPSTGLLLFFLAGQARLAVTGSTLVRWTTAAEGDGPSKAPLVTLQLRPDPVSYDEEKLLPLFLDTSTDVPCSEPPPGDVLVLFAGEAEATYAGLPAPRTTVQCEQHDPDNTSWHIEFGAAAGMFHYLYVCNVWGHRELRLADLPTMRRVIDESVRFLAELPPAYTVHPAPHQLRDSLVKTFPRLA
jgi:SAM-dependent methyltransferase